MYTESRLRTIAKTISWRVVATLTTIAIVFYFTGEIAIAATVGAAEVIAKIILYFLHERGWNLIESGKYMQTPKLELKGKGEQRGCVIWLTGLSASGKSTIAYTLEEQLLSSGYLSYVLDGDNIRDGLNSDLSFSAEDRTENIRRLGEVASLFADAGVIVITAFISPYRKDRERARKLVESNGSEFIEIYLNTPLEVCENRDPKGLYSKAQSGRLKDFTGISAPYETPRNPELTFDTSQKSVSACLKVTTEYLEQMLFSPEPKKIDKAARMS